MNTNSLTSLIFTETMTVSYDARATRNGHKGGVLWLTGLSGSGKSTLARELQHQLFSEGWQVYVLDGDNIRQGLNKDLGFTQGDRTENIRRIGEVAALFADAGFVVICAFISPYGEDRRKARAAAGERFHMVHLNADIATCEQRDVKGLYKKARAGEIPYFTGVSDPYEQPQNAELTIDSGSQTVAQSTAQLYDYVIKHFSNT